MRKWFIFLLISVFILPTSVFADVDDSFNILLNGNAVGYGYTGDSEVYETNVYTATTSENGFRRTYTFRNTFDVGMYTYPLSFVDLYSNDAITSNQCRGIGCNIAYNIPIRMKMYCDEPFCGLGHYDTTNNEYVLIDDNLCVFSGYIYFCDDNAHRYPFIEDMQEYFQNSFELRYIYNFLNNNGIQFYYKNLNGTLITAPASVDMAEITLEIKNDFIIVTRHFINNNTHYWSEDINAKGKIYNNAFSEFESVRLFINYPYSLNNFLFNRIEFSVSNFNVNTTLTGVIPDFPDTPSLTPSELMESHNIENGYNTSIEFFSNFNDNDNNGISSIVSAPLVAIRSMLSNQCTPVSISVYNKQIQLPCGSTFWGRQDVATFKVTYNTIIGGFLCYCILRNLFILIHNMKDPDNDKVEVMDL